MKGVKKCFGVLLVLSIMVGFSLSQSSGANAWRYPVTMIDFGHTTREFNKMTNQLTGNDVYVKYDIDHQFTISIPDDDLPEGFEFPKTYEMGATMQSSTRTCFFNDEYKSDGVLDYKNPNTNVHVFSIDSSPFQSNIFYSMKSIYGVRSPFMWDIQRDYNSYGSWFDIDSLCQIYGHIYSSGQDSQPSMYWYMPLGNFSDFDGMINSQYWKSMPYFYRFNGLMIDGNQFDSSSGHVVDQDGLGVGHIFKKIPGSFTNMTLNFGNMFQGATNSITNPNYDDIYENVYQITFGGRLNTFSQYTLGQNAGIELEIKNYKTDSFDESTYPYINIDGRHVYSLPSYPYSYSSGGNDSIIKRCTITENHSSSISFDNYIDFSCSYNPSVDGGFSNLIDFSYLGLTLRFSGDVGNTTPWHPFKFMDQEYAGWQFQDFYICTNNDCAMNPYDISSNGSSDITGGEPTLAPGNTGWNDAIEGNPGGYGFDLSNLFTFNVLNPFIGIFSLFTHSNECVSIPTLAGMLHAEESSYCPWFDGSTRAILTPVLGLAGTMLVFGYVIRWLSSSSGNFFEDSSHETISSSGRSPKPKKGGK